ncbi:hypothetical protein CDLVIII_0623 [Clostridium sp. DL-VIII]|uniref:AbrB/MazE/SpoVT family DNA-binding domain-containing protein n=1 Tax=Clostridium sp. DL-VIII TaxID=641107 RepID=UPI00023AF602|nr:AbrB/MazE/SpoVT family DNA-binding domain-containing protein [Clostridium sp. DL-VIII]EHI97352.1 hypothetical protein CDLVIII_0623 [Clostridium sp. DL-VIII]
MKRKITLNKSNNEYVSGRLTIPVALLEAIGVNEENREVILNLDGSRLIIERADDDTCKDLSEENWTGITQEERDYLLR